LFQIERIIFIETDGSKVSSDVKEGGGGVGDRDGELEDVGGVAVQGPEVGGLVHLLLRVWRGVNLEADVIQHLERRQVRVIRDPLACR